jgi:hypothetical protein
MSLGVYGTRTLAVIDPAQDVEIFYSYRPTRNSVDSSFGDGYVKYPNPSEILQQAKLQAGSESPVNSLLSGVFNLTLPLTVFSSRGFYSLVIVPKEIYGTITDSPAVLSAYPSIRGIVIKPADFIPQTSIENGSLIGWKISYFDDSGERMDDFRIITSNGWAEAIASSLSNTTQKSISYRYNDNADLVFLTVTPSSAPAVRPNALPSIGASGQTVSIANTKFNPVLVEIEMTDTDTRTLADMLSGDQAVDLENGIVTTYTASHDILTQAEIVTVKDSYTGSALREVRKNRDADIDRAQSWENNFSGV